jgi:hypothetical protein
MYQAGSKLREITAEVGFSEPTVLDALRKEGVEVNRGQVNTRTPPEVEAKVLILYAAGKPFTEIVREAGRSEHTITAVLRRNGIKPDRNPWRLTDEQRERIPDLYMDGMDAPEIGRVLGCHSSSVYNVLKDEGIDRREQIACDNPGYFDQIDTPDKAYWLGFIGADGCVTGFNRGYPRLQVKLARKDRDHLLILHKALKARCPVRDHEDFSKGEWREFSTLAVYSPPLANALVTHGITARKSATLKPWDGPEHLMPHYWRGLFDGDGHITINTNGVYTGLVGSEPVVRGFRDWARGVSGTNANPKQGTAGNRQYWTVQIGGTGLVLRFLAALYDDAPVALARKKALADLAVHGKPLAATLF